MSTTTDLESERKVTFSESHDIAELFQDCSFNIIDGLEKTDANSIGKSYEIAMSDDEDDYGDEETILSISTFNRSLTFSTRNLQEEPCTPLLPTNPAPLDQKYWCEPDATTFFVRGNTYRQDRRKELSRPNLFRLFAVDLIQVKEGQKSLLSGVCSHPEERVQKGLLAEKEGLPGSEMPPFIFCVNIVIPGKPAFHVAFYYAVDNKSLICDTDADSDANSDPTAQTTNSGFTTIASKFFFGDSDKFRDSTFKLIPRIAKGNFVVKKAVGSKPALLGKKVKQHYIQNKRFFELIVDVGSDPIAKKIVGLSRGYAESLVVDMAFLLEAKTDDTLPEQIMGTVRLSNIDFNAKNYRVLENPQTT